MEKWESSLGHSDIVTLVIFAKTCETMQGGVIWETVTFAILL